MKKNSFVEGTIIATLAIVLVKILGMLYVIPFYKIVGQNGGTLYSYAYNIYLIFLGVSSAGLPDAIAKIIGEYDAQGFDDAKNRAYKIGRKLISAIAIVTFVVLFVFAEEIGVFIIGNLSGTITSHDVAFTIRCVAPAVLLIPFLSITKGFLQGHKYIGPSSFSQLIEQIVRIFVILTGSYLALKMYEGNLKLAVGIAISGAFFGGLAAYIYLWFAMRKNKEILAMKESTKKDKITDKEILKKIIAYALPFVIISVVQHVYSFTDQILVLRTIENMGYDGDTVGFIASTISTWSPKICMIINAMAMGMTMSLVPTIVRAIAVKDTKEVQDKTNKALSMIIYISLPLSIGLCVLATSVWTVFYGTNPYGPMVLRLTVFSALFGNLYMIVSSICQSLNKFKLVYKVSITGFVLNALLDVPIMYLFYYIGIEPFLGSVVASMIGYSVSVLIGLSNLKKENGIKYKTTFNALIKTLIPALSMLIVLLVLNFLLPFDELTYKGAILTIIINAIVGGVVYILVSIKCKLLDEIIGRTMLNNIIKKLTLGKLKLK